MANIEYNSSDALPLPLTYGLQWTSRDTNEIVFPGFRLEEIEQITAEVDVWGTVTIHNLIVNALRLRENVTDISNIPIFRMFPKSLL
ncbi:hypothetical protein EH221_07375 [bacterium]|nr:MAG: hypothetical protein EH221_07375 [bacterium]